MSGQVAAVAEAEAASVAAVALLALMRPGVAPPRTDRNILLAKLT